MIKPRLHVIAIVQVRARFVIKSCGNEEIEFHPARSRLSYRRRFDFRWACLFRQYNNTTGRKAELFALPVD